MTFVLKTLQNHHYNAILNLRSSRSVFQAHGYSLHSEINCAVHLEVKAVFLALAR